MFRIIFVGVLHVYYAVRERMDSLYYRNLTECKFESSRAIDVADERAVGLAFCEDVTYGGGFTPEGVREYGQDLEALSGPNRRSAQER